MHAVQACELPPHSLLLNYRKSGAYTDCYVCEIDKAVTQAEYIEAFYTTALFKVERVLLGLAVARPSTDDNARALAKAKVDSFAAWTVEDRRPDQLLLSDYRGRTRSWLMSASGATDRAPRTRLFFGSAVVARHRRDGAEQSPDAMVSVLLPFHKLYSRLLLSAARRRLLW